MRASIPVSVPSARAPSRRCVTCAETGFVACEVLASREREANGPPQRERGAGGERLDERELPAERAAERLGDHANPLQREVERPRELAARDERALRARRDDERPGRLEPRGADLGLEVRLVHPRRA